jgi:hypothetical protein
LPSRSFSALSLQRAEAVLEDVQVLRRERDEAPLGQSRREVDSLAEWLVEEGVRAVPYHAGLADDERHKNQDLFLNEHIDVVVATVAPRCFAIETATAIPRALKLCVGFSDSSFTQSLETPS